MSMISWEESNMDVQYAEYRVFMISRWPCTALFPEFGGFWNGGSQSHHRFQYEMVWFWMILWYPQFRNLHLWLVGALEHFIFFHILGTISHLINIFQRGWNHQPVNIYIYDWTVYNTQDWYEDALVDFETKKCCIQAVKMNSRDR